MTTVYWLQGGGCGGDTYSLLSSDFLDVSALFTTLGLKLLWYPSLSGIDPAAHDRLLSDIDSGTTALDILMVEGSVIFGPAGTGMFDTFRGRAKKELFQWIEERPEHRDSEVGFFIRFAEKAGLDTYGRGNDHFLCFGNFPLPKDTAVTPRVPGTNLLTTPGFATGTDCRHLDGAGITEDTTCSWFEQTPAASHPFDSVTRPYASGNMGKPYSWVKAPRYDGRAAETGPLAEAVMDRDPLFLDLIKESGATALVRQLARITRPARLLPAMGTWIDELLAHHADPFYTPVKTIPDGQGAGMIQAARGALGHWVTIENSKISNYQVITPTAWNGSPRDGKMQPGPYRSGGC